MYLKGGVGVYQSPPRFIVPWPGLEGIGLSQGLNRSYQASLGAEVRLPWNATLDGQVYYNWMPNLSEYPIGDESARPAAHDSGQATYRGRAYGFELIARRRLGQRLFGWVTYSLARAERDYPLAGWRPADFDQTHLVNAGRLVRARAIVDGLERLPLQHGPPLHPRRSVRTTCSSPTATRAACQIIGASTFGSRSGRRSTPGTWTSTSTG